tara:strand:- start:879 stop:1478 length:600 start_codon:yes stop_codon:yes gene_type:complete
MTPVTKRDKANLELHHTSGIGASFGVAMSSTGFSLADIATFNSASYYETFYRVTRFTTGGSGIAAIITVSSNVFSIKPDAGHTELGLFFRYVTPKANQEYTMSFNVSAIGTGSVYKLKYMNEDTTLTDVHTLTTGINTINFTTNSTIATNNIFGIVADVLGTSAANRVLEIDASSTPVKFVEKLGTPSALDTIVPITKR